MKLVFDFPDSDYSTIRDSLNTLYGYGQNFSVEGTLPDPDAFFQQIVIDILKEKVKNYLVNQQASDIELSVKQTVDAINITAA